MFLMKWMSAKFLFTFANYLRTCIAISAETHNFLCRIPAAIRNLKSADAL